MASDFDLYVGIDWGSKRHAVCVLDREQRVLRKCTVEHSVDDLAAFSDWLYQTGSGEPERVGIALEAPRGAVVEMLVERGFAVFHLNPKQLDRFRDRFTVAGAKDDRRDALVLADSLRTDQKAFHRIRLDNPLIIQLREASRLDEELKEDRRRLTNRLREQLHRYVPQVLNLSPGADEPWLWAVLELSPTPEAGRRVTLRRAERVLREHRITRLGAAEVRAVLQSRPLPVAPGTIEAASQHVASLVRRLKVLEAEYRGNARTLRALLKAVRKAATDEGARREHRDVDIILSMPGVGVGTAATMLAEAGQLLAERDYHGLRAQFGVAPVTKQSGKQRVVLMRRGCSPRLRNAGHNWASNAIREDPLVRRYYQDLRARGRPHNQAARSVIDRLLKVLIAALSADALFEPSRRKGWSDVVAAA
jgi:transposase